VSAGHECTAACPGQRADQRFCQAGGGELELRLAPGCAHWSEPQRRPCHELACLPSRVAYMITEARLSIGNHRLAAAVPSGVVDIASILAMTAYQRALGAQQRTQCRCAGSDDISNDTFVCPRCSKRHCVLYFTQLPMLHFCARERIVVVAVCRCASWDPTTCPARRRTSA
jgi:hypothetical protein